jgi:hypothetical protein
LSRLLIVDESLNKRIAADLRHRGMNASAVAALGWKGLTDPPLLRAIAREHSEAVLITGDDNLPATHRDVLDETHITIAIIGPGRPPEVPEDEWDFDVVQRWAHKMAEQPAASVKRYSLAGAREWRWLKRHRRSPG